MRLIMIFLGGVVLAGVLTVSAAAEDAKVTALLGRLAEELRSTGKATDKVKNFALENLLPQCTNEVFVREVLAQNAKHVSLSEIQAIDKQWIEAEDELPIQKEKLSNACGLEAQRVATEMKMVTELFVMDNQGANVGQNLLTSDYWQGDEAKWQKSFNEGHGGVDIGERKFDKSANAEDQKVSLPIIDPQGEVIGAVCFGLKVDSLP